MPYIKRPLLEEIYETFELKPLPARVFSYLYDCSSFKGALYFGSARKIAADIRSRRKDITWAQVTLKKHRLIYYPSKHRPDGRPYFVSFKILDQIEEKKFIVTRPFDEATQEAIKAGVVLKDSETPEEDLIKEIGKNNVKGRWILNETYRKILTKTVTSLTIDTLLSPDVGLSLPISETLEAPTNWDANISGLNQIKEIIEGDKNERKH